MERMALRAKHVVVIGASAGGLEALRSLVGGLPADFPAAVCVVMHMSPQSPGILHDILTRSGPLPAVTPRNMERLLPGRIYVAPPDCHLLVEPDRVRVTKGPRENRFRPAIDPLFRSAAQVYGPAAVGVVLTGNLDDGTAGLWTVKQLGGVAVVQDPHDAMFPSMPLSAITHVQVDHVVALPELPSLLVRLTAPDTTRAGEVTVPEQVRIEVDIAKEENAIDAGVEKIAHPSSFACPECHGVLLQLKEAGRVRFRCHTGHAYSIESLLAEVSEGIEEALWNAVRALEEGGMLLRRMAEHLHVREHGAEGTDLEARAEEVRAQSDAIRQIVSAHGALTSKRA